MKWTKPSRNIIIFYTPALTSYRKESCATQSKISLNDDIRIDSKVSETFECVIERLIKAGLNNKDIAKNLTNLAGAVSFLNAFRL